MNRRRQAGFTLTELMAVMAIMGVLAGLAALTVRSDPVPSAARRVANLVQEARRQALARGPTGIAETARASLFVDDLGGGQYRVAVYRLDAATATWETVTSATLPRGVEVSASSAIDFTFDGNRQAPILAYPVQRKFYPGGSAEPVTLYVRRADDRGTHLRMVVYPASGIMESFTEW